MKYILKTTTFVIIDIASATPPPAYTTRMLKYLLNESAIIQKFVIDQVQIKDYELCLAITIYSMVWSKPGM